MNTSLHTTDGLKLHLSHHPAGTAAHGIVVLVHGLGEHLGRYAHVIAHLNGWGWHVLAYDQRGHGRSEGARGRLATGHDLLDDLSHVIDAARTAHRGPLVLLGHSMGGLVVARFAADTKAPWWRPVDGLVMSSPALDPGMNGVQKLLLAVLDPLAPSLAVGNGLKPAWISRDPAVVAAYVADPLVHDRVTPRLVRFIVDGGEWVRARAAAWTLPTLLLYAGSDRCVAPAGSRAFAAAAPPAVVTAQAFPALFHEIFNEPEQAEVFAALQAGLRRFTSARP
jgi:alpha-beta hydrolase superfamily lysophospholipase